MADVKTGSASPDDFKTGATDVSKIYAGSTVIWQRESYDLLTHDSDTLTTHDNNQISVEPVATVPYPDPSNFDFNLPVGGPVSIAANENVNFGNMCQIEILADTPTNHDSNITQWTAVGKFGGSVSQNPSGITTQREIIFNSNQAFSAADSPVQVSDNTGPTETQFGITWNGTHSFTQSSNPTTENFETGSLHYLQNGYFEILYYSALPFTSTWIAPTTSSTVVSYSIEYRTDALGGQNFGSWISLLTTPTNASSYAHASASSFNDENYYQFRMKANYSGGSSNWVVDSTTYLFQAATYRNYLSNLSNNTSCVA
jgi:hypothetical protein